MIQFKLPVSGVKDVKKGRIRSFLETTNINITLQNIEETRVCDTCGESKPMVKGHYRVFGYGFKKRCLLCDIKACETTRGVRIDVKTIITKNTITAICSKCKKSVSIEDFFKNRCNPSGRESQCKNCSSKNKNRARNGGVLKPMRLVSKRPDGLKDNEKWCIDCKNVKNKTEYRKRIATSDGCQTYCRACDNARTNKNRMKRKIKVGI